MDVVIIGGGITGLTLALSLQQVGIRSRIYEAAPAFGHVGVGINLMPHAMREITELGLGPAVERLGVATAEMCFYNRFGQFIYKEPRGRQAGYDWPQVSVHRAYVHGVLADAVRERLGPESIVLGHRCIGLEQDGEGVSIRFAEGAVVRAALVLACDGIHSVVRRQLCGDEGAPVYQGINMWRGTTRWHPFLSGSSMVQAGWLDVGKMVIYPIEARPGADGLQLINWVAELRSDRQVMQDWNVNGRVEDILPIYAGWRFPWLDVPGMMRAADQVLEYPMVDREPIAQWTYGRITLAGDAAHPMYPRGGNGAGQGILDARTLAGSIARLGPGPAALKDYESKRAPAANQVVMMNRSAPPDTVLQLVHERTGDRPFERIGEVVSDEELQAVMARYKKVAGFDRETLKARPSLV
jgi:2-polyprenyl-6-methoxyphenol hydroxylase-like FAD-dependent oxidoreductase